MSEHPEPLNVVLAEDDSADEALVRSALLELERSSDLYCVGDGVDLLDYLEQRGRFADAQAFPRPDLVVMDLDMPRMRGDEALRRIRANPALREVPVVVLTGRGATRELVESLEGAALFSKPFEYDDLVVLMHNLLLLLDTGREGPGA
jgi:two-component system response regulator